MSSYQWKTKKDKILENARRDPFLKIEDLAKLANTTQCYVRTILSEANISLMRLRKEYAKKMENRDSHICERLLLNYLNEVPFIKRGQGTILEGFIFNSPADFELLKGDIQKDYHHQAALHQFQSTPICLSSVLCRREQLTQAAGELTTAEFIRVLCDSLEGKGAEVSVSNIHIEVELGTNQVAGLLDIPPLSPIVRVRQAVREGEENIALMLLYFNYKKITLSLARNGELLISPKGF